MESQSQYATAIAEATKVYNELLPKDQWNLESDKGDFQVYTRKDTASGLKMARGDSVINKAPSEVLKALSDPQIVLKWDDSLTANEKLESKDGYDITRSVGQKQAFVTQRETLLVIQRTEREDGSIFVVGKSIEHPSYAPRKEYVRAEITVWGWLLTPDANDRNKTNAVFIIWLDPKGSIPSGIFNAFVEKQAQNAKKIKDYVEKN